MQAQLQQTLSRSDVFCSLSPLSADATAALDLRANRGLLGGAPVCKDPNTAAVKGGRKGQYVIKLDYALLFGRRCLSFGSSRSNEFQFPQADDIGEHHFIIHFEMQTAVLLLTDTSLKGTWIFDSSTQKFRLLRRATYPVLQTTEIRFGQEHRYCFRIVVVEYMRDLLAFSKLFRNYARSINKPAPTFLKGTGSMLKSVVTLNDRFVCLHRVGRGEFETIHTCLRLADGMLFAAKKLYHHTSEEDRATWIVGRQYAQAEVRLLSRIRHPNIVRFVDQISTPLTIILVMEFLPIGSLAEMLDELQPSKMEAHLSRRLLRQCLHAIQYLHDQSIVHGNVNPTSVLVHSRQPLRVKLCNFSYAARTISLFSPQHDPRASGCMTATMNQRKQLFGADIWALGVLTLNVLECWPWQLYANTGHADSGRPSPTPTVTLPDFQHLPCATLLNRMLQTEDRHQYSAADCLRDPWLQQRRSSKRRRSSASDEETPIKKLKMTVDDSVNDDDSGIKESQLNKVRIVTQDELGMEMAMGMSTPIEEPKNCWKTIIYKAFWSAFDLARYLHSGSLSVPWHKFLYISTPFKPASATAAPVGAVAPRRTRPRPVSLGMFTQHRNSMLLWHRAQRKA